MTKVYENWAAGDAYEYFMGRWSREVATKFVQWLAPIDQLSWLDVGCGTGALSHAIQAHHMPQHCIGIDPSLSFTQYASNQHASVQFTVGDARSLPFATETFDSVVSGLALNFVPQPEKAIEELHRVTKIGGTVATYLWDYAGKMEFLRYFWDAAVALDASASASYEGNRFKICQPQRLEALWKTQLEDVTLYTIDIPTHFENFEQYWQPFTVGNFPAPQYVLSLSDAQRETLKESLRATLKPQADGSIHLIARAWAIKGIKRA